MQEHPILTDTYLTNLNLRPSDFGGKVWGLIQLKREGFSVPEFVVIPSTIVRSKLWEKKDSFKKEIIDQVKLLQKDSKTRVILRSSSILEDQKHSSCAGVFKSVILENVEDTFQTIDSIVQHAENEIKKRNKYSQPEITIILQRYIKGNISGVSFSVNPLKANPQFGYAECIYGENKLLVDGKCLPTRFTYTFFPPKIVDLSPGDASPEHIREEILETLVKCTLSMEQIFKYPVDIEWTWDGENVYFLQVRYITSLKPDDSLIPNECSTSWFFDQRFIEPITPFTQTTLLPSVIKMAHSDALQMRKKIPEVKIHFFAGQVYIPHIVYINMFDACPKWWLSEDLKQLFPGNCPCSYKKTEIIGLKFWINSLHQLLKHYKHSLLVISSWKEWQCKAQFTLESTKSLDLSKITPEEWLSVWNKFQLLSEEFLAIHRWAILWANYVYRLGGKYLASIMRKYDILPNSITHLSNTKLLEYLNSENAELKNVELKDELITKYGHRSENLDYASPRWAEMIDELTHRLNEKITEDRGIIQASPIKTKIKHTVKNNPILNLLPFLFNFLIKFINLREEQRFEWEKILFAQKLLALEAGKRMVKNGILKKAEDIWFLHWEEFLDAFLHGKTIPYDFIPQRKHEWCIYHGFHKPLFIAKIKHKTEPLSCQTGIQKLKGIGVSYGKVRGIVHIMNSSDDLVPSIPRPRILVGETLNPGQTWCMEMWDGFILQTGSELSHPAILAREYQIPMITAVENALDILDEGETVEIDCESGSVWIIKNQNSDSSM